MASRIKTLDGLRAMAALGVLWIHSWTIHGNPRLIISGLDITAILAIGGNGVDLFFVISGFCMYYFYGRNASFSYLDFWRFLKKRWLRLSPAFYAATAGYILYRVNADGTFPIGKSLLTSIFYLNSILPGYNAAGLFWTLSVEWQFYLVIPFILIYQQRISFVKVFLLILCLFVVVSASSVLLLKENADKLSYQIIFRYFEFMWGIILARIMMKDNTKLSHRKAWFVLFVLLTYAGRILISGPVLSLSENYHNFIRIAGFSIMSCGFSGIIYLSLTSEHLLHKVLGNKMISMIGRISYSFYLWHGLVSFIIGNMIIHRFVFLNDIRAPLLTFILSTLILIPISLVSYNMLEKPFIATNHR